MMNTLWQDLRYGARMLVKQPGFTLIAVLTLSLGIGANTAIFSVINALILNPPQIAEADRVAAIWRTFKDRRAEGKTSYLELADWRAQNQTFEAIEAYKSQGYVLLNNGEAELLRGMRVSSNFLSLIRVKPIRGRDFLAEEEKRGAPRVALIGYDFWQSRMGGKETAVGEQITLNGQPFTIIGILPPGFDFPLTPGQNEIVTTIAGEGGNLDQRGAQVLNGIGRLKAGVTFEAAQADLTRIMAGLEEQYPGYNRNTTAYLVRADEQIVGSDVRRALWVLVGAVGFLLLIACTNVTNLLLVRASARQKELALRVALGANTWRIARHLLSESLLLALLAGGAGLLAALWGLSAIQYYGADQLPRLNEVRIDARVLGFTFAISMLTAILFSLLPVIKASRPEINEFLKAGAKTATSGGAMRWWRNSLVVAEVALGIVLMVGAGLMLRSFTTLVNIHPGFDPENVLTGSISLTSNAYQDPEERVRYVNQTLERLRSLPGVESAAFIAPMPFSGGNVGSDFRIEGRPQPEPGNEPTANNRSATADYFRAMRIPLRKGRFFTEHDRRGVVGVAIINEALAARYFPDEEPLGKYITRIGANQNDGDPERWEIVGVVGDVRHNNLRRPAAPEIYLPFAQNAWSWGNFFIRTKDDPAALAPSFAETIRALDRSVVVTRVRPLTEAISVTVAQTRFYTLLFALFGATGLLLTLTGIYGVISYTVTQQTQEIGIRMALGAEKDDILKLIIGQGMVLTLIGTGLGIAGALSLTKLMQTLLFGISASDPLVFVAAASALLAVALAACYVPARRAAKVDPLIALRNE